MKKNFIKIICMGVVLIMCVGIMCACNNNDDDYISSDYYGAIMLDRANILMKTEFLGSLPSHEFGQFGDTILVVKDEDKFNETFIGLPLSIDFEKEMLIVCVFADINYGFPYKLKDICVDNEILKVSIYSDLPKNEQGLVPPCSSSPTERTLVIKMNRINYSELKIIWS